MKQFITKDIEEVNSKNICALKNCPKCGCDVYPKVLEKANKTRSKHDLWISGCPKCSYSFCD
jgi:ssDNA-binding Zn-finger/Zn-ribbon topoisomerase 1